MEEFPIEIYDAIRSKMLHLSESISKFLDDQMKDEFSNSNQNFPPGKGVVVAIGGNRNNEKLTNINAKNNERVGFKNTNQKEIGEKNFKKRTESKTFKKNNNNNVDYNVAEVNRIKQREEKADKTSQSSSLSETKDQENKNIGKTEENRASLTEHNNERIKNENNENNFMRIPKTNEKRNLTPLDPKNIEFVLKFISRKEKSESKTTAPAFSLENLSNTCYLNSALQLLACCGQGVWNNVESVKENTIVGIISILINSNVENKANFLVTSNKKQKSNRFKIYSFNS